MTKPQQQNNTASGRSLPPGRTVSTTTDLFLPPSSSFTRKTLRSPVAFGLGFWFFAAAFSTVTLLSGEFLRRQIAGADICGGYLIARLGEDDTDEGSHGRAGAD